MTDTALRHGRTSTGPLLPDLLPLTGRALDAADAFLAAAKGNLAAAIAPGGRVDPALLEGRQFAAHGYAWMATYVEALRQMRLWAERLELVGGLREQEALMLQIAYGEYLAQLAGGIALSQVEVMRPHDLGLGDEEIAAFRRPDVVQLITHGNSEAARARLAELLRDALDTGDFGHLALGEEALDMVRDQFRRFGAEEVAPFAHAWHLEDKLIPLEVVEAMSALGVFGLTVPEEFGGLGLGKLSMCIVSEELSRAYIGVGSLGTRSEIAAELIRLGGTAQQKAHYLPKLASGEILPTAVFTEPNTGSDLGSLRTRAVREGDVYRIYGAKTWITHAARADLMTLLVRTDPATSDYRGLSMFLAAKPRGS
ncbi:MAG TPA: acyl-CoA dehydrogenase family protein, partial [Stellaceae bacterium]|nr:acyl-CoA dehydrogenase family protein [Stellaceae bacterium]